MGPEGDYSPAVLDHFRHPRNAGAFQTDDPVVVTGEAGSEAEGQVLRLQLRVDTEGVIRAARFQAHGDPYTIAAGSLLGEWLPGRSLETARGVDDAWIAQTLSLPPLRLRSAVLAAQALVSALVNHWLRTAANQDGQSPLTY